MDPTTRPGIKTTEFWTAVLTALYFVANATGVFTSIPSSISAIAVAIITAAYALSRGSAKRGAVTANTFLGLTRRN